MESRSPRNPNGIDLVGASYLDAVGRDPGGAKAAIAGKEAAERYLTSPNPNKGFWKSIMPNRYVVGAIATTAVCLATNLGDSYDALRQIADQVF